MKRLTGTNKEIAELLYQEQLELSKENRDVESTVQAIIEDVKKRGDVYKRQSNYNAFPFSLTK